MHRDGSGRELDRGLGAHPFSLMRDTPSFGVRTWSAFFNSANKS
jgi:hypothetical protein